MTQIGLFTRTPDGYRGRLQTLCLDAQLALVAVEAVAPRGPDYRVHLGDDADGPDIGAGWRRTSEKAGSYVALVLDDPQFARPIRANLFPVGAESSTLRVVWSRPVRGAQPS